MCYSNLTNALCKVGQEQQAVEMLLSAKNLAVELSDTMNILKFDCALIYLTSVYHTNTTFALQHLRTSFIQYNKGLVPSFAYCPMA